MKGSWWPFELMPCCASLVRGGPAMIHTLITNFAALEDPRCPGKIVHKLIDILVIAVCAVVAEADTFEDIALYGRCKQDWLKNFLELPNGIPSHDTFRRVLMLIDPEAFEHCFLAWVREVFRSETAAEQIAIDGKTARRSFNRRRGRSPLHLVSAYATGRGLVLAQRATPDKRGEVTVLPEILDGLALQGTLVSLDALACRGELADAIVSRGGDYLITLKANQGRIYKEVRNWFAEHAFGRGGSLRPCFDAFDDGHGRLVRRRVFACPDVGVFATLKDRPGLRAVLAVETIRGIPGGGRVKAETRHYLSSAALPPEALAVAIRNHWRVEIVFTQMTKVHRLAAGAERDDVADLDLAVADQHAVDQQLHQLALAREVGSGQARPNPPAEVRGRGGPPGELGLPVRLRLQLAGLRVQRLEPLP